jgi:DNA repair photolyase
MDHAAWLDGSGEEEAQKLYQYYMRPDPDMRDFVSDRQEEEDPLTGTVATYRMARVANIRNAKDENKRTLKVYLGFDGKPSLPHIRLDTPHALQGWYQDAQNDKPGSRERPCYTDAILTQSYGGYCAVGCAFCYINSGFRGYRGSGLISVPLHYGDYVAKQLAKQQQAAAGYFSSFTDCFVELENYYHNTQRGAEAFVREGLPVFFLSRLAYPGWAYDLLAQNKYSYAQKSINTPDPEDWKKLSPGALPLMDHLDEIRELRRRGIYVSIQVNPIIAGITTQEDILQLIEMLAEAGANHLIFKYVEANHPWAGAMVERISKRFGDNRGAAFRDLFVENSCGGQKTVTEEYRREAFVKYRDKCNAVGVTMGLCYEYTKQSGEWHSMGAEFLTADQCHGQRVPMFTRPFPELPFSEITACPPSGCLTCASDNGGEARCGDEDMGKARARRGSDFLKPIAIA